MVCFDLAYGDGDVFQAVVESYIVLGRTLEPQNPVGFYKEQLEDHLLEQVFRHYEGRCVGKLKATTTQRLLDFEILENLGHNAVGASVGAVTRPCILLVHPNSCRR